MNISKVDFLKEAAFNYGRMAADYDSAVDCHMPTILTDALESNRAEAESNLLASARLYFNDVYDGE